jgi:hypothetical protein
VFWAYIAFSQFMLIWYGNIPEETLWFAAPLARRLEGRCRWRWRSGISSLPFFFLLLRTIKRHRPLLAGAAVWMLADPLPGPLLAGGAGVPARARDASTSPTGLPFVGVGAVWLAGAGLAPGRRPRRRCRWATRGSPSRCRSRTCTDLPRQGDPMTIDTRDNDRSMIHLAAVLLAAVLLTFGAACGGGETADAPAGDATAGDTATTQPSADADLEPGNAAVEGLGDGSATISGTISFAGTAPTLRPVTMDADPQCAQKHDSPVPNQVLWLGDGNTMGNVFVQVKSGLAEKQWPAPSEPAVIDQDGCIYHPHVTSSRSTTR